MSEKKFLPYGQWPSRITPQNTGGLLELSEPAWDRTGTLFWRERNSTRGSIRMAGPNRGEIIPISGDMNVGGGLLYGGGSFGVGKNWVVFIDKASQQLCSASLQGQNPLPQTFGLVQAASPVISPDSRAVLFIHSDGEQDAVYLFSKNGDHDPFPIIQGGDFYNYPRWHPGGRQLAWISWNHPHMPWDSSTLWLGGLESIPAENPRLDSECLIAGGEGVSVLQPEFSPDGKWLAYISDQSGWWQIHLYDLANAEHRQLTRAPAEHALPPWMQNRNGYGFSQDSQKIYFTRNQAGIRTLWVWDLETSQETAIALDEDYTWLDWFSISPLDDRMAMIASAGDIPPRLITIDPSGNTNIIRRAAQEELPRKLFSLPQPISWANQDRSEVKGLFYPPHNPDFQAEGLPPLLVIIHSGPTRQKSAEYQTRTQFFTSRGFAVLEVNYRGSSGYGRQYRQSLQNEWGVSDVEDCLSGAVYVTEQDWADREKMVLLGSSSGGLTVYQILVRYPGVFQAGIVLYGIVNHLDLLKNPPKFERYYSDWSIGPYPENEKRYRERSPVFFADRIQDPIAVFQGGRDPIVPRNQADQIIQELISNHVPHLYVLYPDEGHGFKAAENIEDFYRQSLQFLDIHLFKDKGE